MFSNTNEFKNEMRALKKETFLRNIKTIVKKFIKSDQL